MFVMTLNLNTTVTPWHEAHTAGTNLILREDGGTEFYEMFNSFYASQEFLIKPDFTWEQVTIASDSTEPAIGSDFFTSKDIEVHKCGGTDIIGHEHICQSAQGTITVLGIAGSDVTLNLFEEDLYAIKLYTVTGQLVRSVPKKRLTVGKQSIALGEANLSKGIYFVEVSWSSGVVRKKVVLQ